MSAPAPLRSRWRRSPFAPTMAPIPWQGPARHRGSTLNSRSFVVATLATLGCLLLIPVGASSAAVHRPNPAQANAQGSGGPAFVPGELIVRYKRGVDASERASATARAGVRLKQTLLVPGLELVDLAAGKSVKTEAARFEKEADVLYAEPNYIYHVNALPNDTRFGELWGLNNTGQSVQLSQLARHGRCRHRRSRGVGDHHRQLLGDCCGGRLRHRLRPSRPRAEHLDGSGRDRRRQGVQRPGRRRQRPVR